MLVKPQPPSLVPRDIAFVPRRTAFQGGNRWVVGPRSKQSDGYWVYPQPAVKKKAPTTVCRGKVLMTRFSNPNQRANVAAELASLQTIAARHGFDSDERLAELKKNLKAINESLWVIEDQIRRCEQAGQFGSKFIELARSVCNRAK